MVPLRHLYIIFSLAVSGSQLLRVVRIVLAAHLVICLCHLWMAMQLPEVVERSLGTRVSWKALYGFDGDLFSGSFNRCLGASLSPVFTKPLTFGIVISVE